MVGLQLYPHFGVDGDPQFFPILDFYGAHQLVDLEFQFSALKLSDVSIFGLEFLNALLYVIPFY